MIRSRAILANDRGVIAPATAVMLAVLVGMVGLVTDTSVWYAQRRQLQAVTDAAALAAAPFANSSDGGRSKANAVLTANGLDPTKVIVAPSAFTAGQYCPERAVGQRFNTSAVACDSSTAKDAVRITTGIGSPLFLSRLFTSSATTEWRISTTATAARINQAGLQAGSGLAALNDGVANALLSALTGSTVSLSAVQYDGLVSTNVDALTFLDALATQLNVKAGTYSGLLDTNVGVGDVIAAQIAALNQQSQVAGVAAAVAGLSVLQTKISGNPKISLGKLLDLGLWADKEVGSAAQPSALHAGLNLMQLTSFSLQLANGKNFATIPSSLIGIPNLASIQIAATAIEPPVKSYFSFGPEGTQVHTAQVRLLLKLEVLNLAPQLGLGLNLPLYIEVASGDAVIDTISCSGNPAADAQVAVTARSGLANFYLGTPSTTAMTNFSAPVPASSVAPVTLLKLGIPGLLTIGETTAGARVSLGSTAGAGTALTFVQPSGTVVQPNPPTRTGIIGRPAIGTQLASPSIPARATSDQLLSNLLGGLADSLVVTTCPVDLFGLCLVPIKLTGAAVGPLFNILDPLLSLLDGVIDGLLRTLGVQVGYVDVAVTGVRCGQPVLVS